MAGFQVLLREMILTDILFLLGIHVREADVLCWITRRMSSLYWFSWQDPPDTMRTTGLLR